jgi:hypothetical protein
VIYPHQVFWFIITSSIISGMLCAVIGKRKLIGSFVGGVIGFTFGLLAFTFIFFLPGKRSADVSKLRRYKSMLEEGLISRSEYINLTEMLSEEHF